mgnify:CR=1 FL=1
MANLAQIVDQLSALTVMEAAELSKMLEEKWGVSAAAPVAVAAAGAGAAAAPAEEKTEFTVVMTKAGDNKINAIKAIRTITGLGLKEAKDLVDAADKEAKVVKEGMPKADAEKAMSSITNAMGSIYTSDFHKQNAGKIIFSKNPIILKQENASTSVDKFTLKDHIYGMVYLKGRIKELTDGGGDLSNTDYYISVSIDGNKQPIGTQLNWSSLDVMRNDAAPKDIVNQTAISFEILPDPKIAGDCDAASALAKFFAGSSPREHEVIFYIEALNSSTMYTLAEGKCQIDFSQGQEDMDKMVEVYHKIAMKHTFPPNPLMRDAGIENEMMSAARSAFSGKGTPAKAVITDHGWGIVRHQISGIILRRRISGVVSIKGLNGQCKLYPLTFDQDYSGGGYGKAHVSAYGTAIELDCDNVNK